MPVKISAGKVCFRPVLPDRQICCCFDNRNRLAALHPMIGSIVVLLLLLTCLAEGIAQGHPQRATRLKNLRLVIVVACAGWAVQDNWSSTSLTPWLMFGSLDSARLFMIAFLAFIVWLATTGLLESMWASQRAAYITANTLFTASLAFIMGATVDWDSSAPFAFVFVLVQLVAVAGITWKAACTVTEEQPNHAGWVKT